MSTLFGLIETQDVPLQTERFRRMEEAAFLLRPSKAVDLVVDSVALGTHSFRGGPARERPREAAVVFQGRLDNRRDLARELAVEDSAATTELIAAAYEAWGMNCPVRMSGAFVFALWDPVCRRLVCARDALGVMTFYYTVREGRVAFASQLRQVLAALAERPDLNEDYLAVFLLHGVPAIDATPYQGLCKLPPGHVLVVEDGEAREHRYWRPEERPAVVYSDLWDYAAHYLELLRDGVRAALRADEAIWCDLSGGLDSSSLVCLAQELIRSGEVEVEEFATFTALFGEEDPEAPADPYVQSVLDKYPVEANFLFARRRDAFENMAEAALFYDEPNQQIRFYELLKDQREMMERSDARTLIRGIGAESTVLTETVAPLHLADLLRSGRLLRLVRELSAWQKTKQVPLVNLFTQYAVAPLIRPPLDKYNESPTVPDWIDPDFSDRLGLRDRINCGWMPKRFDSVGNQWQYEKVGRISCYLDRGFGEAICESRHPFLHRPLVEYSLAIPYEHKILPGHFKPLLRRAMAGILPDTVRFRFDKSDMGPWVIQSISRQWPAAAEILKDSILESLGLVNGDALHRAIHELGFGKGRRTTLRSSVVTLEQWLRVTLDEPVLESAAPGREVADARACTTDS